jgi:YVTN family beta-propeller protein
MMRRIITILYILLACQIVLAQRWAYVLNGNAETLSRLNLQTGEVTNHIVNTGPVPNQVAYYDSRLYVVNSGSASLQIINPANNQTTADIQLPINSNPLNVAFYDGCAYVSGFLTNSVYKVNLSTNQVTDTIRVGQSPAGLIIANDILCVCNTGFNPVNFTYGQGSVSIIDISDGQELTRISVGKNPQALIEGPDGSINVICTGNYSTVGGSVHFIDPALQTPVDTISIGGEPFWPVIDDAGNCYVSAGGWSGQGKVFCYDAITHHVLRGLNNPIYVELGAMGLAIDSTGILYCTAQQGNSVTKFNNQGQLLGSFSVGGGPVSITIIDQRTDIIDDLVVNPATFKLGVPYPNPFNSQVVIPIVGQNDNKPHQAIEIIDVGGRIIKSIPSENNGVFPIPVIWDGRNSDGKVVSTGVYFARLAGTAKAIRLVLLR